MAHSPGQQTHGSIARKRGKESRLLTGMLFHPLLVADQTSLRRGPDNGGDHFRAHHVLAPPLFSWSKGLFSLPLHALGQLALSSFARQEGFRRYGI